MKPLISRKSKIEKPKPIMTPAQLPHNAGKCQCISFNNKGFITESDNKLFNAGAMMGRPLADGVPFIGEIYNKIRQLKAKGEPLFFPHVKLKFEGYNGICDLIFTKEKRATGEVYVWFIYDHTLHYGHSNGTRNVLGYGTGKGLKPVNFFK